MCIINAFSMRLISYDAAVRIKAYGHDTLNVNVFDFELLCASFWNEALFVVFLCQKEKNGVAVNTSAHDALISPGLCSIFACHCLSLHVAV